MLYRSYFPLINVKWSLPSHVNFLFAIELSLIVFQGSNTCIYKWKLFTQICFPFHYCCYTVYHFASHKRNNLHEKGIKMYNFIIKSIIFKMSIYLYYVMLFTIHVEYILYPHSQSGGYTGIPLSVRPSLSIVYVTSHLSFVGFYSYLVSWLAMIWACAYYTDFTDGWFLQEL
jgi:hypothetical protein